MSLTHSWIDRLQRHAGSSAGWRSYWPGPLTVVLPARAGGTVALRVPDSLFLRELLIAVGEPLYSTSVNRAGQRSSCHGGRNAAEFEQDVDLIYDAGATSARDRRPRSLDATTHPARILRQGALR